MDAMDQNQPAQPGTQDSTPGVISPPFSGALVDDIVSRPLSYWLKKFFACNPFYLVSAALLLYGLSLVSSDATFLNRELPQLAFNFGALQFYEALLVGTAILLARRRIWYDSMLLVGLENLLILVPFIFISQAALLTPHFAWFIILAGGVAALVRFWSLKTFLKELNLPRRSLVIGLILLVINVALPLVFRHLNESKIGTKPTDGAAYEINRYGWLLLLPAMLALVHLVPRPRQLGDLLPQRRWLPMALFALWFAGSGVHLYSLSYVYNFDWETPFYFPLLWLAVWSLFLRHKDFLEPPVSMLSKILLTPPLAVAVLALMCPGNLMFDVLTVGNVLAYACVVFLQRNNRTALHFLILSLAAMAAGLLQLNAPVLPADLNLEKLLLIIAAGYLLFWVVRSRDPKVGLLGALGLFVAVQIFFEHYYIVHFALQTAMVFLLLHSLRWEDDNYAGARLLRNFVCGLWVLHACALVYSGWGNARTIAYCAAGLLLAGWILMKMLCGQWRPLALPLAATVVLLARPGNVLADRVETAPTPLLVVAFSFLLFGLGTLAALTKSRWNPPPARQEVKQDTMMP